MLLIRGRFVDVVNVHIFVFEFEPWRVKIFVQLKFLKLYSGKTSPREGAVCPFIIDYPEYN